MAQPQQQTDQPGQAQSADVVAKARKELEADVQRCATALLSRRLLGIHGFHVRVACRLLVASCVGRLRDAGIGSWCSRFAITDQSQVVEGCQGWREQEERTVR